MTDLAELKRALVDRCEPIALAFMGEPTSRSRHELRWGRKGGRALIIAGAKRGTFADFETDQAGGLLDLIMYSEGCSFADACRRAEEIIGSDALPSPRPAQRETERAIDYAALGLAAWAEGQPIAGAATERYLQRRCDGAAPPEAYDALRHHPACTRRDPDERLERRPAMLALLTDAITGAAMGCHRTFLEPDGSDRIRDVKGRAVLGSPRGCVIRLSPDDAVLDGIGLSEGVETGLNVLRRGWRPIWSAISAGGISTFPVLSGVGALTIFSDNDHPDAKGRRAGQDAAEACGDRWAAAQREVVIRKPKAAGSDWADLRGAP